MKSRVVLVLATSLLSCLVGQGAQAALFQISGSVTYEVTFPNLSGVPILVTLPVSGTATVNGVSGHLTSVTLSGGLVATTGFLHTPTTTAGPVDQVRITASNGPGMFSGSGGMGFGGVMPINGFAYACLGGTCMASGAIVLPIPLNVVGAGGTTTASTYSGFIKFAVQGAPWTTGMLTATYYLENYAYFAYRTGSAMGPLGQTSSTAMASGTLTLVTPVKITSNLGSFLDGYGFGTLSVHIVPEPGTGFLLLGGLIAVWAWSRGSVHRLVVAWLGRRRG